MEKCYIQQRDRIVLRATIAQKEVIFNFGGVDE
jgi:hypothetical protein